MLAPIMKKILTIIIIVILIMGIFSIFKKSENDFKQQDLSRPEFNEEFFELIKKGYDYLTVQQKRMEDEYAIGTYESWDYDQETGFLSFSNGDTVKIKIQYEEVGSISKNSKTWLWAWANPHLEGKIKSEIEIVKRYGIENKFEPLTKSKWYGNEYDGWEMAGISALLMNAKGAYRVPTENTFSFMIYKEVIDLRE